MAKAKISESVRAAVLMRDGYICRACGYGGHARHKPYLDCDHAVSEKSGGAATVENLQCLCKACNILKGGHSYAFKIRAEKVAEEIWEQNQQVVKVIFTMGVHLGDVARLVKRLK